MAAASLHGQPKGEHWVATWATAQNLVANPAPSAANATQTPPANPNPAQTIGRRGFDHQTVRMMVRTSIPGRRTRLAISNAFNGQPVEIGAAHIALRIKDSEIDPKSDHALTFNGKPGCTIRGGVVMLSDPVDLVAPSSG